MEFTEVVAGRHSVRKFQDRQVPRDVMESIVDVARLAPSWKNTQIARYIFVTDPSVKAALATEKALQGYAGNARIINGAPCVVVEVYKTGRSGYERDGSYTTSKEDYWEAFDAGIAAQTFCLAAWDKGLGTVIMGIFEEAVVAEVVGLEEGEKVGSLIALGYPEGEPKGPDRKEVADLVRYI